MERSCVQCGKVFEAPRALYCSAKCRTDRSRGKPVVGSPAPVSTVIADQLHAEFMRLGVLETYEAQVALGTASQLDARVVQGAAYVSLSKELDRRVDALRLRAERPDDPAVVIRERFEEKRLRLVTDETSGRQVR